MESGTAEKFKKWLDEYLKENHWNYSDLAEKSNLDTAVISNIVNGKRGLGISSSVAIGEATKVRPDFLLRKYGAFPPLPDIDTEYREQLDCIIGQLSDIGKSRLLEFAKFLLSQDK